MRKQKNIYVVMKHFYSIKVTPPPKKKKKKKKSVGDSTFKSVEARHIMMWATQAVTVIQYIPILSMRKQRISNHKTELDLSTKVYNRCFSLSLSISTSLRNRSESTESLLRFLGFGNPGKTWLCDFLSINGPPKKYNYFFHFSLSFKI